MLPNSLNPPLVSQNYTTPRLLLMIELLSGDDKYIFVAESAFNRTNSITLQAARPETSLIGNAVSFYNCLNTFFHLTN